MTGSQEYTYGTRKNGEVEIMRGETVARTLRGEEAEDFLAKVKDGNADQVIEQYAGSQAGTADTTGTGTHPAMEDRLDGPVPHGDGEPRETDGEERPSE